MNDNLKNLIRKAYYEDKYKKNIDYFENELKKDNNNRDLVDIIVKYYITKEPNLEKIIYYCNYRFENESEILSNNGFEWYIRENKPTIESLEQYNYPFVHKYLGEEYLKRENMKKALEHFKKGAEQKSFFCADRMFRYYTTGKAERLLNTPPLENIDFEKAIYYANKLFEITDLTDDFTVDEKTINYYLLKPLEEANNITKEEKNRINNIIMNSRNLLFCKSLMYLDNENIEMFLYYCELSASKGYYGANILLAEKYLDKDFPKRNLEKALYYANKIYKSEKASTLSSSSLYEKIIQIINEEKNIQILERKTPLNDYILTKLRESKKESESNGKQLNELGCRYYHEKNYKKAIQYFEQAIQAGNSDALVNIGIMYYKGDGVKRDYKKAMQYYELSAQAGNSNALVNIGIIYHNGAGVKQDYEKAMQYYELSAQTGNINALNNLGFMYLGGHGVNTNYWKSRENFQKVLEIDRTNKRAKAGLLKIKYSKFHELNEEKLLELFEYEKDYYNISEKYIENISEKIQNGAKIVVEKDIKNITIDKLNRLSDDTIIILNSISSPSELICKDFYTCKDMKKIIKTCNKILENIDLNQKKEDVFMQIYIKLGMMISYDYAAVTLKKYEKERNSTSGNLMTLINKKGVCAGYSVVLKNILDIVGIESKYIVSEMSKKGISHAYNQVKINGIWYNCDLTWDSNYIKLGGATKYCLKSENSFEKNIFINSVYHKPENETLAEKAPENFKEITSLFYRNYLKLFKNKIKNKLVEQIVTSPIIDEGGKRK